MKENNYITKSLDEGMRHNQAMERLPNPDEKFVQLKKAKIEAEKQQNINDHKANLEYTKSLNKEKEKPFIRCRMRQY